MTAATDLLAQANAAFTAAPPDAAELSLISNCTVGTRATAGPNANTTDPANNPRESAAWLADRHVRGELIRWICVTQTARALVDPRGINLFGARITGELDLSDVTLPFPLKFEHCGFEHALKLSGAQIPSLDLSGTWVPSIAAEEIKVGTSLLLKKGFHCAGMMDLTSGKIGGDFDCGGALIENPHVVGRENSGKAMEADNINIGGNLSLNAHFSAQGEVHLIGAQIGGEFSAANATFANPPVANQEGPGYAIYADRAAVKGTIFLGPDFRAEGRVSFAAARISGSIVCNGGNFQNHTIENAALSGTAFLGDNAAVDGDVQMASGFRADGKVRLWGARISGDLYCLNGNFQNQISDNPVSFGDALACENVRVGGDAVLKGDFGAQGRVHFLGAQIGGDLDCTGGRFAGELTIERSSIKGTIFLSGLRDPQLAVISLSQTSAGAFNDDWHSWPPQGRLSINGFTYGSFFNATDGPEVRLAWLDLQPQREGNQAVFYLQPYQQLSKVLRDSGNNRGAQRVLYFMEMRRRSRMNAHWFARAWSAFLRFTIGYGYYPTRPAICWILAVTALGTVFYWNAYLAGRMVPTQADAYKSYTYNGNLPNSYERFHALVFSLENSFPLVKLGQVGVWQPDPWQSSAVNDASLCIPCADTRLCSYGFLRRFQWVQILLGWFYSGMIVAGVTGLVRKS